MSVDTRDKRMSLMGFGEPVPFVMANPDGTVSVYDRAQLLWLYAGLNITTIPEVVRYRKRQWIADWGGLGEPPQPPMTFIDHEDTLVIKRGK